MARSDNNLTAVLQDTANAIKTKKGSQTAICPRDFADEVASISTGIEPSGTLSIIDNDIYDVTQYASVNVQVPIPEPSGTYYITSNDTYEIGDFEFVNVNVPQPSGTYYITDNGVYDISNYSQVSVSVSSGGISPIVGSDVPDYISDLDNRSNLIIGNSQQSINYYYTFENGSLSFNYCEIHIITPDPYSAETWEISQPGFADDGYVTLQVGCAVFGNVYAHFPSNVVTMSTGEVSIDEEEAKQLFCNRYRGLRLIDIVGRELDSISSDDVEVRVVGGS